MRLFSVAFMACLILLAGCATPPPSAEFGAVPGPSKTRAVLPPDAAMEPPAEPVKPPPVKPPPAEKPKVAKVEKPKTPASEKPKAAPIEKSKPAPKPKAKPTDTPPPELVTPDASLTGKVSRYNEAGRFVVLEFPIAHLPAVGQRLFVYRNGLKTGELKVTGPQRDDHTVADITTGEAQVGDDVREQ